MLKSCLTYFSNVDSVDTFVRLNNAPAGAAIGARSEQHFFVSILKAGLMKKKKKFKHCLPFLFSFSLPPSLILFPYHPFES